MCDTSNNGPSQDSLDERIAGFWSSLQNDRENILKQLLSRFRLLESLLNQKSTLNIPVTEREAKCFSRLTHKYVESDQHRKGELIFTNVIKAVESGDSNLLNSYSLFPFSVSKPPQTDEDLDLDKILNEYMDDHQRNRINVDVDCIRMADILKAVDIERGVCKEKSTQKRRGSKCKASIKRGNQSSNSKTLAKKPRLHHLQKFPPSLTQYVRGFFNVLRIMLLERSESGGISSDHLCELVHTWHSSARSQRTNSPWINRCPDWSQVVRHALSVLSGRTCHSALNQLMLKSGLSAGPNRVPPPAFVSFDAGTQTWYWEGTGFDDDSETALLARLFTIWARRDGGLREAMSQLMLDDYAGQPPVFTPKHHHGKMSKGDAVEDGEEEEEEDYEAGCSSLLNGDENDKSPYMESVPQPYFLTDWQCKMSTPEQRRVFQIQEYERFSRPWSPYVYNQHGFASAVGPVRTLGGGSLVGRRSRAIMSARDHPLLSPDRPPWVSISEIVRDAVARLPNGEGTRPEIAMLVQDSRYLVKSFSPKQLSQCISSALDRLQGEGLNSPVMYDPSQRLWIYRHRHLSPSDFHRIYEDQIVSQRERFYQLYPQGIATGKNSRRTLSRPPANYSVEPLEDRHIPDIEELTREDGRYASGAGNEWYENGDSFSSEREINSDDDDDDDEYEENQQIEWNQNHHPHGGVGSQPNYFSQPRRMALDYKHCRPGPP